MDYDEWNELEKMDQNLFTNHKFTEYILPRLRGEDGLCQLK